MLSFAAANAGGMTRDVLIGAVAPAALTDWRYLAMSLVASVTAGAEDERWMPVESAEATDVRGSARTSCRWRR